jgi:hypothetical protein
MASQLLVFEEKIIVKTKDPKKTKQNKVKQNERTSSPPSPSPGTTKNQFFIGMSFLTCQRS